MAVSKEAYEALDRALRTNVRLARKRIEELVEGLEGLTVDELEAQLMANLPDIVIEHGDVAALVAKEWYERQREVAQVEGSYDAILADQVPRAYVNADIREAMQPQRAGTSNTSKLIGNLNGRATKLIMTSADDTMKLNVARDPAHPRWAFVPHMGACGFCIMLGSNGFMYSSEQAVIRSRHTNCTCTPVADFDTANPALEGYNPERMREAYAKCLDTVSDDVDRRWAAMSDEERKKYKGKWEFQRNEVVAEMNRRDREWLRTGTEPGYKILPGAKPSASELSTANTLSVVGYKSEFRPTRSSEGLRTSDVFLVSGSAEQPMRQTADFKDPSGDGNGRWTINHQFCEAAGQAKSVVLDIARLETSTAAERWTRSAIEKAACTEVDHAFTIAKGKDKGKDWLFDEVILVSSVDKGYCRKFIRKGS